MIEWIRKYWLDAAVLILVTSGLTFGWHHWWYYVAATPVVMAQFIQRSRGVSASADTANDADRPPAAERSRRVNHLGEDAKHSPSRARWALPLLPFVIAAIVFTFVPSIGFINLVGLALILLGVVAIVLAKPILIRLPRDDQVHNRPG